MLRACDVFSGVTTDDVVAGHVLIHHLQEDFLDARALFVDGIVQRIYQVVNAFDNFLFVHHLCCGHVVTGQLLPIVGQLLELDALWMCQEQQIDGFVHGLQFHLSVVPNPPERICSLSLSAIGSALPEQPQYAVPPIRAHRVHAARDPFCP